MTKGILWIVLTEESKRKLLEIAPAKYPVLFADHITLFYNVALSNHYKTLLGTTITIKLKTNSYNDKIQAITVGVGDMPSQNSYPHITLSALEGVKPVQSNTMLKSEHIATPIFGEIEGIIEFKEF